MKLAATLANYLVLSVLIGTVAGAVRPEWRSVTPEELASKQSKIDPAADAQALFRKVWMDSSTTTNYVRLKIFSERGLEKFSTVKLEYWDRYRISDCEERVALTSASQNFQKKFPSSFQPLPAEK